MSSGTVFYEEYEKDSLETLLEGIDISNMRFLDPFAKEGKKQTCFFSGKVRTMEVWEIDEIFTKTLTQKFPDATVRCVDSIERVQQNTLDKFDLVIIDSPLSTYCNNEYAENFEIIEKIGNILSDNSIVIINICTKPFNMHEERNKLWKTRRSSFFGMHCVSKDSQVSLTDAINKYVNILEKQGLAVEEVKHSPRSSVNKEVYLHHGMFRLSRVKHED